MKNIDIISDIHTSRIYEKNKTIFGFNGVLKQNNDFLIIAGDINENIKILEKSLDDIIDNTTYKKVVICFGNHDLRYSYRDYNDWGLKNSIEKYEFLINRFHEYKGKIHVIDKNDYIIPNTNIILTGNSSWYNYSLRPLDKKHLEKYYSANFNDMEFGNMFFNDKLNIKFNEEINGNIAFAEYFQKKLIKRLENIKENFPEHQVVGISHIKPSIELEKESEFFIQYNKKEWTEIVKEGKNGIEKYGLDKMYGNAFFVNNNISKIYNKYRADGMNFKVALYGHTHMYSNENMDGINYITKALGYY